MVAKIVRTEWKPDEGLAIMYGDAGEAKDGIAVPLRAFLTLAATARRYMAASKIRQDNRPDHGPWHFTEYEHPQSYDVGLLPTTDGEKVALILDRGQDKEIGFAIEPEHARELAHQLSESASQATSTRPKIS